MPMSSQRARSAAIRRALSLLSLACALGAGSAGAKDRDEQEAEDVNHTDLAAKLIADGHYDRAEEVLAAVDPTAEGVDQKKLLTLRGLVYLGRQLYSAAAESFEAAVRAGQTEPLVQVYLARAHFGAKAYEACLKALRAAGEAAASTSEAHLMRAQSEWELDHQGRAIEALNAGLERFPGSMRMLRMKLFFLVDLGLYQEALGLAGPYLARQEVSEDDYVAVGEALRAGAQESAARELLERARLRFPASEKIAIQLAHAYLDQGKPTAAAALFEQTARLNSKYYLEAAELYKQARRPDRALSLNARVSDQKAKLEQRLSLLLAKEQYEQVAAMETALSRLNLLADDDVRYALAFAHFQTGQLDDAERHARTIQSRELFDAALQLRKAIETCRQAGWECLR